MIGRRLFSLAVGCVLFSAAVSAVSALVVLSVLHHDPPGWVGAPVGLLFALSCLFFIAASFD